MSSAIRAGKGAIELSIDDKTPQGLANAKRNLAGFASRAAGIGERLQGIGKGLFAGGALGAGLGVALLTPLAGAAREAGNFEETLNRFQATFQELATPVRDFAREFSDAANRSENDVLTALSSFQAFFKGLDVGNAEAAELSKSLTQLAEDFGSFNNLSSEEANQRFISALSGSSEVVDKFGINLKQAALDQEFLRSGIDATTRTASEQQKVMARIAIITRALGQQGAIGDAVRTSDSFVNSSRGVAAALQNVRIAVGRATLETRQGWNKEIIGTLRITSAWVETNQDLVKTYASVAAGLVAGGVAVAGVGATFIGIGAAMKFMGSSAAAAAAPIAAVGSAGSSVGGIFAKLGGVLVAPFAILGGVLAGTLSTLGLLGRAVAGVTIGVATLVSAVGVVPLLLTGLAGVAIFAQNAGKSSSLLRQEWDDLLTILGPLARGAIALGTVLNTYILKPLDALASITRAVIAENVRLIAQQKTMADARRDFATTLRQISNETFGTELPVPSNRQLTELPNPADIAKQARDQLTTMLDAIAPELASFGLGLNDKLKDSLGIDIGQQISDLKKQAAELTDLEGGDLSLEGITKRAKEAFEQIKDLINSAADSGKDFKPLNAEDITALLADANKSLANDAKAGVKKAQGLLTSAGTFSGSTAARTIGQAARSAGEKALEVIKKEAVEQTKLQRQQLLELQNVGRTGALRFS